MSTPREGSRDREGGVKRDFSRRVFRMFSRGGSSVKTPRQLRAMARAGSLLVEVMGALEKSCVPGSRLSEMDALAEGMIRSRGAVPAFKGYRGAGAYPFPYTICASINEQVVHGFADDRILRHGDIFSVDVGACLDGYYADMARTYEIGTVSPEARRIVRVCRECLEAAEARMVDGGRLYDVSFAVQAHAERNGFSVVRDFVGHGIGRDLHEDPQVPNFVSDGYQDFPLSAGAVLAIEPMINAGGWPVETLSDGWTVVTKDRRLSAHFEDTIAVTPKGPLVLTSPDSEEKVDRYF